MTTRREFLGAGSAGLCLSAAPFALLAQQPSAKVARIGFLGSASASSPASLARVGALRAGLRDLGYVEGKNIVVEFRWAEDKYDRLPDLAAELVRLNVDVLVSQGTSGTLAAKRATTTIPIVMPNAGDPVSTGIVASLARPGGNVTGTTYFNPEISAKRLEILKEAVPRMKRVAVLLNPVSPLVVPILREMGIAAESLKLEIQQYEARAPKEFENAFAAMAKRRVDAAVVVDEAMLIANANAIAALAVRQKLPSIGFLEFAEAGGLMAYGVNLIETFRRAAYFVDKILKGAKPADLPIERATKFGLVINRLTARAVGITIPQSILLRADRVIE
jgi:putative ABC transport system substrate-binding protein